MTPYACLEDGAARTIPKGTYHLYQNHISSTRLLWWSYPSSIPVLFDLIDLSFIVLLVSLSHSHRRAIMTLVNVLKQILHGLDAPTCLNIDVAIEQM